MKIKGVNVDFVNEFAHLIRACKFLLRNFFIILPVAIIMNGVAYVYYLKQPVEFEASYSFTLITLPYRLWSACGENPPCLRNMLVSELRQTIPDVTLIDGAAPRIIMTRPNTSAFLDAKLEMDKVAILLSQQVIEDATRDMKSIENDFPKQILGTEVIANTYLRVRNIVTFSKDGTPAVKFTGYRVKERTRNLSVWISAASLFGILAGAVLAALIEWLRRNHASGSAP